MDAVVGERCRAFPCIGRDDAIGVLLHVEQIVACAVGKCDGDKRTAGGIGIFRTVNGGGAEAIEADVGQCAGFVAVGAGLRGAEGKDRIAAGIVGILQPNLSIVADKCFASCGDAVAV